MRAGFAKVAITPPIGTAMMGYGDRDRAHGCEGIHDELFVRAVFVAHAGEEALIAGFDLCFLGREEADRFKGAIGRKIDLSPRQILLNTSHNHAGPSVGTWAYADYRPPDRMYLHELEKAVVTAACGASSCAREVALWAGSTRCALPMNRRRRDKDGSIRLAPNPEGRVYDAVPLLVLKSLDGSPVSVLFSVSCHPTTLDGFEISADYPGVAMDLLDKHLGTSASLFLQGVGADANPCVVGDCEDEWRGGSWEDVARAGAMVAEPVALALEAGLVPMEPEIHCACVESQWPLAPSIGRAGYEALLAKPDTNELMRLWAGRQIARLERGKELPTRVPVTAQGMQIGRGVRLIGLEGEPVAELGLLIRDFCEEGVTFPLGCTNGAQLYLPTSDMLDEGGYEVESYYEYGHPAPLAKGLEGIVRDALEHLRASGVT
jgi:hypothetical protein